ncbi:MAG: Ldh family oxidoreductase [Burkholderiaceae bacterium]
MGTQRLRFDEVESLARRALLASRVSHANAGPVARSIACAERDGQAIVGLSYLPTYCDHAACGKVDGFATPTLELLAPGAIRVDARTGFAHPAIALGLPALAAAARANGIAVLSVGNSYACGSLGYFVEELGQGGLVALMAANASPSIAPWGGKTPFFGTNPLALAVPRADQPPLVIDQSSSTVAWVAVNDAHQRGLPLPLGWALDKDGRPTTDADAGLAGSMMPLGGYKGAGLALLVDILSAGLTGSNYSHQVSSFGSCEGGPTRCGQLIVAFNPELLGGPLFCSRLEAMLQAMRESPAVRLPGERRLQARAAQSEQLAVPCELIALLTRYAEEGSPMVPN